MRGSTIRKCVYYGRGSIGGDVICYRVLGWGEDFIVGMSRAVKVGFSGARSSDVQAMGRAVVNGLK